MAARERIWQRRADHRPAREDPHRDRAADQPGRLRQLAGRSRPGGPDHEPGRRKPARPGRQPEPRRPRRRRRSGPDRLHQGIVTGTCDTRLSLVEAIAPPGGLFSYRRKNCNGEAPDPRVPCELQWGVDPNRNYGMFWGGPGSSSDPDQQTYRGTGPWSEPETQAVHEYSQQRQVTMIMTIHNVAALVLRPPGLESQGFAPDEARMKEIGDAMADHAGYTSQYGFQLYDTTGTTEDWNYATAGRLRLHGRDRAEGRRVPHAVQDRLRRPVDRRVRRRGQGRPPGGAPDRCRVGGEPERPLGDRGHRPRRPHAAGEEGVHDADERRLRPAIEPRLLHGQDRADSPAAEPVRRPARRRAGARRARDHDDGPGRRNVPVARQPVHQAVRARGRAGPGRDRQRAEPDRDPLGHGAEMRNGHILGSGDDAVQDQTGDTRPETRTSSSPCPRARSSCGLPRHRAGRRRL